MMDSRNVVKTSNPRRRKATRILRPGEIDQSQQALPPRLGSYERFFASLLRSQATDFLDNKKLLEIICQRLQLTVLTTKLLRSYPDVQQHFSSRATLVMEEARHGIAQGLLQMEKEIKNRNRPRNGNNSINNNNRMRVTLRDITFKETTGHSILTVSKQATSITNDELSWLRPGTVVACVKMELADTIANITLGCILPLNREDMISSKSFTVMVFQKVGKSSSTFKWELTPIASLLSEHRKFQACMENIQTPVPFYRALLGQLPKDDDEVQVIETKPGPRSTPAENDDYSRTFSGDSGSSMDDSISSSDGSSGSSSGETGATRSDDNTVKLKSQLQTIFRLPRLNEMQESAASCFLNADPNTITLIQGPPGTGKSTLIVAILARLLLEKQNNDDSPRKIMVCCPTNKAISVLCTRFLDCLQDNDYCSFPFSVLLVGDDGKLLDDDVSHSKMSSSSSSKLRSIFLYTWITTLLQDYSKIRNSLAGKDKRRETPESLFELARNLQRRLQTNLPSLPRGVFDTASKISTYLQRLVNSKSLSSHSEILVTVSSLLATIREWKREAIWHQLLSSARVVFCTLASAGAAVLKKSNFVADDLIVDEAAAATEPELSIPFGFHPRRMLAVGDPRQLPAMVGSQRAAQLGLGQSLHERLMYDCGYPHIMLNVQYRMRPELSQFPSQHFYEGKIVNGPNVKSPGYIGAANVLEGQVYSFLQVTGRERQAISGSFENEAEAQTVVTLVQELQKNGGGWNSADRIRIITFYQAQVTLLKRLLQQKRLGDIVVATVDSSQGCEADIVIISFVRSMGSAYTSGRRSVGFLSDDRRMNVALTRAKYQLVGVGNWDTHLPTTESMASMKEYATTVYRLAGDAIGRGCMFKWPFQKDDDNHRNRGNSFNNRSRDSNKRASSGKGKEHAKRPRASSSSRYSADGTSPGSLSAERGAYIRGCQNSAL